MNTHSSPPLGDQVTMETLDPCAWPYVLTMDDLPTYRLTTRSDVVGAWEIRVLLLPPEVTRLTRSAFAALKKDPTHPTAQRTPPY